MEPVGTRPEPSVERELRPKKSTFILLRLIAPMILLFVFSVGGGVGLAFVFPLAIPLVLLLALVGLGIAIQAARVAYRKETYRFLADRIITTRGGLLSDQTTELDVRNITQVKLRLPWPRYPLFKVGDVMIESAGSGASEIVLRAIVNPERVYADMADLMRSNGFALARRELLHEEKPDLVGVIIECLGIGFFAVLALGFAFAEILGEVLATGSFPIIALLTGVPLAAAGFLGLLMHFLDMRRRTYRVFDDTVVYEEGFLTRENAFFPAENLADSNTKRTFVDQVLGLYDVGISCQGSGSEVKFRRLRNGDDLSRAVDKLAETFKDRRPGDRPEPAVDAELAAEVDPDAAARASVAVGVPAAEAWTGEFRMHTLRAIFPGLVSIALLAPLAPIWILAVVAAWIQAACTSYEVRPGSVRSAYKFLTATVRDFTYDKITGVAVHEGPVDRLFGTVTVDLWSIGAGEPLTLRHVRRSELNLPALLRQAGIPEAAPMATMPARFGPGVALLANIFGLTTLALVGFGLLVSAVLWSAWLLTPLPLLALIVLGAFVYAIGRYRRVRATFFEQHVEAQDGLLWRDHFYARYANIKKVTLVRYPGSDRGRVQFFVAGERRIQTKGKQPGGKEAKPMSIVPYNFIVSYVEGIDRKAALLDTLLERPDRAAAEAVVGREPVEEEEPVASGRPHLGNSMVLLLIFSVFVTPLLVLLPVTAPLTFWRVRRRSFRLEANRAICRSGLLYRTQTSVLYDRIDAIRHKQGALGKMFSNGEVVILTAGSSAPDLVMAAHPGYMEFHEEIQRRYRRRD
jgi:membrane protein YdbS with pleckstrin-like domain